MAYTEAQAETLRTAIARGVKRVRYADREVEYADLDAMRAALADMEAALASANSQPRQFLGYSRKGLA